MWISEIKNKIWVVTCAASHLHLLDINLSGFTRLSSQYLSKCNFLCPPPPWFLVHSTPTPTLSIYKLSSVWEEVRMNKKGENLEPGDSLKYFCWNKTVIMLSALNYTLSPELQVKCCLQSSRQDFWERISL